MSEALAVRFRGAARGRPVAVRFEPTDFALALDWRVTFRPETDSFDVMIRRGGCFEGAYRSIERWIEAKAEHLDGIDDVAVGHLDLRSEMDYWAVERIYEQFRADLESAVADKVAWLQRVRPNEGILGEVTVEARASALAGVLGYLARADVEVRRGVLSPETIDLLKVIGLDVVPHAG